MSDSGPVTGHDAAEAVATGPGAALREARVARGLSVEEISTDLRIEPHLLHALENEDYAALGAPVFAKGYIRQYASRLGLDAVQLVERYTVDIGHADVRVQPSRVIKLRDSRQATVLLLALAALALVVVFLLIWWFDVPARFTDMSAGASREPATMPFPEAAGRVSGTSGAGTDPVSAVMPPPAAGASATAGPREAGTPAQSELRPANVAAADRDPIASPEASDAARDMPDAVPSGRTDVPTVAAAHDEAPADDAVPVPSESPGRIEIVFTDECWVEISDANGARLLYGLIAPGARHVFGGVSPPIDVFLGNAAAADIRIDGRDFAVPRGAESGNLARFAIDLPQN